MIDERTSHNVSTTYYTKHTNGSHVNVPMQQIQPQPCFVTNLTLISQHLGWKQPIISLVARQPKVIPYPPYPMRYNIVPSLICTYGS
jgi:hypothetical protein